MVYITSNRGVPAYGIKTFLLDSKSDVEKLPTQGLTPGSKAFVTEDSSYYILNTARKWVKTTAPGSGGGGGSDSGEIIYTGGDISEDYSTDPDVNYDGEEING
jgi:hypothetical protein